MRNIYMTVGLPGSGKSTVIKSLPNIDKVFESDAYRLEIFKNLTNQDQNAHQLVFQTMHNDIVNFVKTHKQFNIVYDATNINFKKRTSFYNLMKPFKVNIIIVFVFASLETALKQNLQRVEEKHVPESAIKSMYKNMNIPIIGKDCNDFVLLGENFFNAFDLENTNNLNDIIKQTSSENIKKELFLNFTPHESSYHKESVDEHINLTIENAGQDLLMKQTAIFHDLGKGLCKTKNENNEFYNYKNHENIGAYYALNYLKQNPTVDNYLVAKLCQFHMLRHSERLSEKAKLRRGIDNETWLLMTQFAEIDSKSAIK